MQRNAKTHLSKTDAAEFQQRWRAIKSSWNLEVANQQFELLCDRFAKTDSTFIGELRKKRQHYLAFLNCPESIRRSLSTTNVVEAINGQLEIMRRNSGGYFHSQDVLKLKLGLAISSRSKAVGKLRAGPSVRYFPSSMPCSNPASRLPHDFLKHNFVDKRPGSRRFDRFPRNPCTTARSPRAFIRRNHSRTQRRLMANSFPACTCLMCRFLTSCSTFNRSRSFLDIHSSSCHFAMSIKAELSTWLQEELLIWPRHFLKAS